MTQARIRIRELDAALASGAAGASAASAAFGATLGERASLAGCASVSTVTAGSTVSRSWWDRGLRIVRDAAIAVAIMALVPVGLVTFQGDRLARTLYRMNEGVVTRAAIAERARSFRLPADPSITPMQAGLALNAWQLNNKRSPGFEPIEPVARPVVTWRALTVAPDMFATARPDFFSVPSTRHVLEASVRGFSPPEMEYLRALASAPVWREFDLVARARAVDVVGGQFRIPFGPEATAWQRPLPSFRESRELAYAAVSRAAYYMALGQRDSAEMVLRSIISFGFSFVDNGSTVVEGLIGDVMVGVGRDALQRFYVIEHDPRASSPALAAPDRNALSSASRGVARMASAEERRRLLARIEDPATPFGERLAGVQALSAASCTNVRELLIGPSDDVSRVLARARQTVARFPSEQALIDLETRRASSLPDVSSLDPVQSLLVSSAAVAGAVLHNPRLASCTRILIYPFSGVPGR
jgi:hypothetical protein